MEFTPTPEILAMIASVILSLLFSYVPGLRGWFDPLGAETKRLIMLGCLVLVTGGSFGLACAGVLSGIACTSTGAIDLIWGFVLAVIANQSAYAISPRVS